ncbi:MULTISPECIES: chromosomal replication initiator protein DnaA [unclassified Butyrivibrio]|uniref:chromosomal replication initiator protein DnaA n=1 Tax=unclassified Butyrivibrio TaxID=2639466 RepID=UPI0003B604BD|nr:MULTISPECIES: chromosomal replication initiator protein DnaA [unclassified Butyrivibrio]SDB65627.1 chromosomal replication initiator protein [Butyrivibrio sp. INlla16]SEL63982.1 chromosomal replication initiator protein [Butyrivibrio sp. ob235]
MEKATEITQKLADNFESLKEEIRVELGMTAISFDTWIKPLSFYKYDNGTVIILIPFDDTNFLSYIERKYQKFFKVTLSEFLNENVEIEFLLEKDAHINNEETTSKNENETKINQNNYEFSGLNSKYIFDTYVVGGNNRFAYNASLAVAESPGEAYNPLFLYGGPGLGKTHLMHAIGHFIIENHPNFKVLYVTSEQFTNEVIESIRSGKAEAMSRLRDKYRTVDVLMVDDVQFIIGKESTQEEFFHTFNVLHQSGKQIIISSDKPPKEMETLEERFRSRFEMGLISDIQAPDYETRMAILKKNAESYSKHIDDEIFEYIATNIKSNIRELEGAYNKIIAFSRLNNVEITLDNAKEALKDIIYPDVSKVITIPLIISTVCEQYGVKQEDIASKKRNKEIVLPRQIAMYLARELTDSPLEEIGKSLGKKDHTTVMSGINKIKDLLSVDEDLRRNLDIINKKLNPSV